MLCAVDIDGTLDSNPREFQSIMQALRSAGHTVAVVTGTHGTTVAPEDWQQKAAYLTSLGCGECYDTLTVIAHMDGDLPDKKAAWMQQNHADVLIDNDKDNAKAAMAVVPLVLVPWASRQ